MAADVVWLGQAKDDVRQLIEYLFPKNPTAALAYIAELEDACSGLAEFPLKGRQYDNRYRAIVVRNHIIFYRYDSADDAVVIVTVLDSRRDLPGLLESL